MSDEKRIKPLTPEEIEVLRQIVEGQRAMRWLRKRSFGIATWVGAVIAGWLAFKGVLSTWLAGIIKGSGGG